MISHDLRVLLQTVFVDVEPDALFTRCGCEHNNRLGLSTSKYAVKNVEDASVQTYHALYHASYEG
jgi:hypothetical protein